MLERRYPIDICKQVNMKFAHDKIKESKEKLSQALQVFSSFTVLYLSVFYYSAIGPNVLNKASTIYPTCILNYLLTFSLSTLLL